MNCNCNNNGQGNELIVPKIKHVYGNVLRVAIPLTLRTLELVETEIDGQTQQEIVATDTDFIPSSEHPVRVIFSKVGVRFPFDAIMRDGNVAYVEEKGKIPVGTYDITITCYDDNGNPYRFNQNTILQVVNSTIEAGIETPIEYEVQTWYLNAALYLALKGEDGVGIDDIETESSGEIGGINYITFVLTDGRTRTFTILNGSGTVDQELDTTSQQPIANKVVATKFNELDENIANLFGDVDYDSNNKVIRFWNKGKTNVLATIDARPFVKDGMVSSVYISGSTLVVTFNTDSGREAIGVPLTSIFNPNNYYNKTQVDNRLAQINAMFSSFYNKSQIDTMLANIDVEGYAELDGLGELAYVNSAPVVLDEINSSYTSVYYNAQQYDFLDGTVRHCTDGKIRKYCHAIDGKDPFTGVSGTDETIYVGVYRPSQYLFYYNKHDGKFYKYVSAYDSSTQTVVQFMSEIEVGGSGTIEQVQSDWNETDATDPSYIKNKPTIITQSDIDTTVAALVDSAPQTLDTLNELAAALGDDPNFATTVTNALGNKVDKVNGKGLSTNDYTTAEKNKLAGIASGAEVNVQADWNVTSTSSDAFIRNKPTIPTKTSDLLNDSGYTTNTGTLTEADFDVSTQQDGTIVMTVGVDTYTINLNHEHPQYVNANDLDDYIVAGTNVTIVKDSQTGVLTISSTGGSGSSTQVQANWNESDTTSAAYIQNKPTIPDVSGKADKSEMSVSANGDQTTIQLKSGTSATVINQHQSLNGYAKYVLCQDEASYNAIQNKDSDTLYLIPEASE